MSFWLLFLLFLASCVSELEPGYMPKPDVEAPGDRMVTLQAVLEQPEQTTRTALESGGRVVWSAGDEISVLTASEEASNPVLRVTLNRTSQGLGIPVQTSTNHYVRYTGIKVTVNNADVTQTITKTAANTSNSYKVGIYNSNEKYQYAAPNTVVTAQINSSNNTLPLVQSSSSSSISSSNQAVVQLEGIQYSSDNQNWIDVQEGFAFKNGSQWGKNDVSYEWIQAIDGTHLEGVSGANARFTLNGSGGLSTATFTGTLPDEEATIYALYPYAETNSFDGTALKFQLPEIQTYTEGTFAAGANPAAGIFRDEKVQFHNLCGVLELKLTGTEKVTQITVADKNPQAVLWGIGSIPVAEIGTAGATFTEGTNQVTLSCGAGVQLNPETPVSFYFVVPAGSFSTGFTATVSTPFGQATLETSRQNVITRSRIHAMPACPLGEVQLEEFNLMNDAASTYFQNSRSVFTQTDTRYGSSFFTGNSYRADQPRSKTITFSSASAQQAVVTLAKDQDFSEVVLSEEVSLTNGTGSYDLRNMVPGNTYYYRVTAGTETLLQGAFRAVGQVRMIGVDGVYNAAMNLGGFNIRDLGGWTGWNQHKLLYEKIYRGASLGGRDASGNESCISAQAQQELYRIGIRAHLDLRATNGGGAWPSESSKHSYSHNSTTLLGADFCNIMTDYGYTNQDASLISDVAWIIYELKQGKPVYFNCRQGADRTGAVAFLLEGLLGCYEYTTPGGGNQMAVDYELTGFSGASRIASTETNAYRPSSEVYGSTNKIFRKIIDASQGLFGSSMNTASVQDRVYYYLNQYAKTSAVKSVFSSHEKVTHNNIAISKEDLDWFVNYMLGITDLAGNLLPGETVKYVGPAWAQAADDLRSIAEGNANTVIYF